MPLYEFKCRECEHTFEVRQAWKDPFPDCPECAGEVKKVFHPAALVFKGSGWHVNDYGKSGPVNGSSTNGAKEAAEKAADKSSSSSSSSSDSSSSSSSGSSSTSSDSTSASGSSKPEAKTGT